MSEAVIEFDIICYVTCIWVCELYVRLTLSLKMWFNIRQRWRIIGINWHMLVSRLPSCQNWLDLFYNSPLTWFAKTSCFLNNLVCQIMVSRKVDHPMDLGYLLLLHIDLWLRAYCLVMIGGQSFSYISLGYLLHVNYYSWCIDWYD